MEIGNDWWLTSARAAIHLPSQTAVVADLHLGYGEARRRSGEAVPTHSLDAILSPLEPVIQSHDVKQLVIAGDLLESGRGDRQVNELLDWVAERKVDLRGIVVGNHDRGLNRAKTKLPTIADHVTLDGWRIVHGDQERPSGRIVQGHLHPCLRWQGGASVHCYLFRHDRLILPAYSSEAAGVNVLQADEWQDYECYAIAQGQVLMMGELRKLSNQCNEW